MKFYQRGDKSKLRRGTPKTLLFLGYILLVPSILAACTNQKLAISATPVIDDSTPTPTIFQILPSTDTPNATLEPGYPNRTNLKDYVHPDQLIQLKYPTDWSVSQKDNSVEFKDPAGNASLLFQAIKTEYPLDENSLERFITARENNTFSRYENYFEHDRQLDMDKQAYLVNKSFTTNGQNKYVATSYRYDNQVVYILEYWSNEISQAGSDEIFTIIRDSASYNEIAASKIEPYMLNDRSEYTNAYFSLEPPVYWELEHTQGEYTFVDTFHSPDERALLQIIVYDDGEQISRSVAGDFVQVLLRDYYTTDIDVTSDIVLPDGRERLEWKSTPQNYRGRTYFETQGSALIVITTMAEETYAEDYLNYLDQIIATYQATPDD